MAWASPASICSRLYIWRHKNLTTKSYPPLRPTGRRIDGCRVPLSFKNRIPAPVEQVVLRDSRWKPRYLFTWVLIAKNHELDYRPRSRDTADPEKLKFSNGVVEYLLFRGGLVDAPSLPSAACTCTGWLTSAGRLDPHGRAPAGVAISGSTLRLPRGQADPNSPILTRDPSNA